MATHAYARDDAPSTAPALLARPWYWNYVLGATLIGNGLGPSAAGKISDWLKPSLQNDSLRYALVIIGVVNFWAALHYWLSSTTVREDLEMTERLARA